MFELNSSREKNENEYTSELNFVENRANEPIFELNLADKLRFGLNIAKNTLTLVKFHILYENCNFSF